MEACTFTPGQQKALSLLMDFIDAVCHWNRTAMTRAKTQLYVETAEYRLY